MALGFQPMNLLNISPLPLDLDFGASSSIPCLPPFEDIWIEMLKKGMKESTT